MGGYPDPGAGALINRLANPPNPVETLGTMAQSLDAARQFQAKQAMAGIYSQAIDPTTGQLDMGKLNSLIGANPAAAYMAGQNMQQAGQAVGAQGVGTQQDIGGKTAQLDAISRLMFPLYKQALNGPVPVADAQTALDQAHQMGLVNNQQYQQYSSTLKTMPNGDAAPFIIGANEGNNAALNLAQGHVQLPDVGPGYQPVQTGIGAAPAPGGLVPKALSPAEVTQTNLALMQPKERWQMPDGSWRSGSVGQWMTDFGLQPSQVYYDPKAGTVSAPGAPTLNVVPPAAGGGGGGGAPAPEPTGRPAPPPPVPPPAGGPTTQGGGKPSISPKVAGAGEDAYNDANADMPASRTRVTTAQLALQHLQGAVTGGTGTEAIQAVNNFLGSYPTEYLAKVIPGYDPSKAASDYQEAAKYMQQITNASIPGGQGTNEKLAAAAQATPNPHMQNRAAQDVLQTGIAGELMKQHVVTAFNNSGLPPAQFQQYASQYARTHDPRAFMFPTMTPDQRAYLQKTMPKGSPAAKMFNDTLYEAVQAGDIPDPMPTKPGAE